MLFFFFFSSHFDSYTRESLSVHDVLVDGEFCGWCMSSACNVTVWFLCRNGLTVFFNTYYDLDLFFALLVDLLELNEVKFLFLTLIYVIQFWDLVDTPCVTFL